MEGSPYCGFDFVLSSLQLKDGLAELFIGCMVGLGIDLAPMNDISLHQMFVHWVGDP